MNAPIPDLPHYIVGWKAWQVTKDGRLSSYYYNLYWSPREAKQATCQKTHIGFGIPHNRCSCGIYAAKSFNELKRAVDLFPFELGAVVGRVALWGRVIEHEFGWRAEFAYPLSFSIGSFGWFRWGFAKKVKRLRELFGVEDCCF